MQLHNKIALISGGGRGIGRAAAHAFAAAGARVIIGDIDSTAATAVAQAIGNAACAVTLDVTQADSVAAAVATALDWGGRIDILLNNAGITRDARLTAMSEAQWDAVLDVNLKGAWLCGRAVAPQMITQGHGSIINVSSIVGIYGNFGQSNYAATKGGLIAMTKTWARELGPHGIRCNAVAPGFIATDMVQSVPAKVVAAIQERTPLRRMGSVEELAAVYVFLASDAAGFINGAVIPVDGGLTL
ncbi:MAG TPA: 3-oxoacyl-ACP reductase FabG [Roseiflexaceae bacterium]|nr:3-oxoacyl-ACP reductase FabG [Roseiflexaceae bacterium]